MNLKGENMKIYTIGEVLVDMMMEDYPIYHAKFGGAPANVAMNVAKFGADTYFLGNFGDDYLGSKLKATMEERHIDLSYTTTHSKTTLAFVSWDENGERDFQFYSESDQNYTLPNDFQLSSQSIVHFGGATAFLKGPLEKAYDSLFKKSIEAKSIISFDPNFREDLINDLEHFKTKCYGYMDKSNLLKLSEEEANILKEYTFKENQLVCITLGAQGSRLIYQGYDHIVPSIEVTQVDSTGAGDAFISALIFQISQFGFPNVEEAITYVEKANRIGALTSTQYGAIDAVPDWE
mgnify:CR=1 FL=1